MINLVLPYRISVWEEAGKTKLGMLNPTAVIGLVSHDPRLTKIDKEIEDITQGIINDAK